MFPKLSYVKVAMLAMLALMLLWLPDNAETGNLSAGVGHDSPSNEQLYKNGLQALQEKNYEKAIEILSLALSEGSTDIGVLVARGEAYFYLHRYKEALADLNEGIKKKPGHIYGLMLRAAVYDESGQTSNAIQDLSQVLLLNPQNKAAYVLRGVGYASMKRWNDALSDLNQAAALGAQSDVLYRGRAVAHEKLGQYDQAVTELSRLLELQPGSHEILTYRSWMYFCLGNLNKGLEDLNTVLKENPNNMKARVRRGWGYLTLKDFHSASSDLAYAIEHGAELPLAHLNLAAVHYEVGELSKAFSQNEKIFHLSDQEYLVEAWFQKGLILLALKRDDEAMIAYARGRSFAEKSSNLGGVERGIEDLKSAQAAGKANAKKASAILASLKKTEDMLRTTVGDYSNRCHHLII